MISAIYFYYRVKNILLIKKKIELAKLVKDRTLELELGNEKIEEQTEELRISSENLKSTNKILLANQALVEKQKDELVTTWWTRKEAVAKYTQLGGKMNFRQMNTNDDVLYAGDPAEEIHLISDVSNGYAVSIAV